MFNFLKKYTIKIALIFIVVLVCGTMTYISTPKKGFKLDPPKISLDELYEVVNVLDGDTFEVKIGKSIWKARMIGVDTPETLDPRKPVQCYGYEASENTKQMLNRKQVSIQLDPTQDALDKFNRLLAYVYLDDVFVNQFLIEKGFGREYTYSKKYKFQKEFRDAEKEAKKNKVGLWLSCLEV